MAEQPQRLYFSRLQDPEVWPVEEPSYEVRTIRVEHTLVDGCVLRIESGELLVSPDSLARARAQWPQARVV